MARSFTANGHRIEFTNANISNTTGTIAIHANPAFAPGSSTQRYWWNLYTEGPSMQRWTDNNFYVGFSTPGRIVVADTGLFSSGVWAHFALTYKTGASGQNFLINGISKGTAAGAAVSYTLGTPFYVGCNLVGGLAYFNGSLYDFAVWNVVLTSNELLALAAGIRPCFIRPTSLVIWAPLDGLASPEPDLSGNRNNGTVTGTAATNNAPINMFTPRWPSNIGGPPIWALYVSKNSGAYQQVTTTSTFGVKSANASSDADDTVIKIPRL